MSVRIRTGNATVSIPLRTMEKLKSLAERDGIPLWGVVHDALSTYESLHRDKRPAPPTGKYEKRGVKGKVQVKQINNESQDG